MNKWLPFVPLAALAVVVIVGAFLLLREGERQTVSEGLIGRPAPAYALARLDEGATVTSEERQGRAYVINLFASWCAPCRAEHPQLMQLAANGAEIVGVAYKDTPGAAADFLNELGDPFSVVALDPEGRFGLELGVVGVPETFVVGPDGAIRAVHRGPLTEDAVNDVILPALAAR